jgi:hypothetical protein
MLEGCFYHFDGGFFLLTYPSTRTRSDEGLGSFDLLIEREVPTTRQPRSSKAWVMRVKRGKAVEHRV